MRVIADKTVRDWAAQYPDAAAGLTDWLDMTQVAAWSSLLDVRRLFPHADAAAVRSGATVTIFNVCGNKYRLVTAIKYKWGVVYTMLFMTHAEYSRDRWKEHL